ncbi:uncharacterized protein BDZ99DRAFT_16973 [Mytilinidion resinicola]|uniref:Uncharacterized protein n=1 Tax=Mytilinidion resinicola TaxID=574789 RepID=A0A6A6ZB90_9PEZI|nr:uncharacterized protein BDZ99DRAFT_16973 [Mytilinidion resinicola]KAF2817487.1 hypothetical protein BDZ99DRAFT_16973 [Mytilinidion resinicola]
MQCWSVGAGLMSSNVAKTSLLVDFGNHSPPPPQRGRQPGTAASFHDSTRLSIPTLAPLFDQSIELKFGRSTYCAHNSYRSVSFCRAVRRPVTRRWSAAQPSENMRQAASTNIDCQRNAESGPMSRYNYNYTCWFRLVPVLSVCFRNPSS